MLMAAMHHHIIYFSCCCRPALNPVETLNPKEAFGWERAYIYQSTSKNGSISNRSLSSSLTSIQRFPQ